MSSTTKTKGIILKIKDTPGKDKLLFLLTETGLVTAFITPKRNAGKKSYTFDIFTYGEIVLYQTDSGNNLVNSITPIENFYSLREDIVTLSAAGYFASLSLHAAADEDINSHVLFLLLLHSLEKLVSGIEVKFLKPAYEFKIVQLLGFTPCLEADRKANLYYFDFDDGRLYADPFNSGVPVSRTLVYCIYQIINSDCEKVFDFTPPDDENEAFYSIAQQYLIYHIERDFDSLKFLNGVI